MKRLSATLIIIALALTAVAQQQPDKIVTAGTQPARAYLMSYLNRQAAVNNVYAKSDNHVAINGTTFELHVNWLDRRIYLHMYGAGKVTVNGREVGYSTDSRGVSEFLLNPYVKAGVNSISYNGNGYIYSQPKVHIEDYYLTQKLDETFKDGMFGLSICMSNSFNQPSGELQVGYELEDATGAMVDYSYREVNMMPDSRDTISFTRKLANVRTWSAENPYLYTLVLKIKSGGMYIEYASQKIGFRTTEIRDNQYLVNGKSVVIKGFNILADTPIDEASFKGMKQMGVNTLRTKQQEHDFYELADKYGFYVLNEANITSTDHDMSRGGSLTNNPEWLGSYMARTESIYNQTKNYPSVALWSLAGDAGRGYNLYKTYNYLKSADTLRPVIYEGAGLEWNSDIPFPKLQGGFTEYQKPVAPVKKATVKKKRR